jgi:Flp pilus assembly protein TadG
MLSPLKAALVDRFRRIVRQRDGNIAMIFGLCAIPVIVGAGIAIDVGRAYMVRLDLEASLDSAALAVASSTGLTTAQLQTRLQSYFDANYPMMSQTTNLQVNMTDPTQPVINVTASVDVPTTFLQLIGVQQFPVAASSQVTRGTNALELALVLDNTGSMMCGDGGASNCSSGTAHIDTLKTDGQQIVDTLFADSVDPTKLKIAVVPYVTAVNVGPAFCSGPRTCSNIATDNCSGDFVDDQGNPIYNPSTAVAPVTFTGNVSNGSTTISSVSPSPSALPAGIPITGPGIRSGTTVSSVTANSITLSRSAQSTRSGATLTVGIVANWTSGSTTLTIVYPPVSSLTAFTAGEVVTGTGIGAANSYSYPVSASIASVNTSNNTITLCQPTTAAGSMASLTLYPPVTYDTTNTLTTGNWKGCVVEPTLANEDANGNGPDFTEPGGGWTAATMGNQTWWASYWHSGTDSSFNGWDGQSDNTWYIPNNNPTVSIQYLEQDGNYVTPTYNSYGPNLSCPTPLVRLTSSQSTLDSTMQNMTAWANSGTAISIGMIWGWRTLSPNPPFSDGQPYGTPSLIKAVVLETDGDAEVGGNTQGNNDDFTGYGYISEGKLGSSTSGMYPPYGTPASGTANYYLQQRLTEVCTNMKNAGIVIFTVGLGDGANNSQLAGCAGPPGEGKFYAAPTAADLTTAFQQIAISLNSLRLTK